MKKNQLDMSELIDPSITNSIKHLFPRTAQMISEIFMFIMIKMKNVKR